MLSGATISNWPYIALKDGCRSVWFILSGLRAVIVSGVWLFRADSISPMTSWIVSLWIFDPSMFIDLYVFIIVCFRRTINF